MKTRSVIKDGSFIFCIQDGDTPAIAASLNGHTETLALLLANKADVNSSNKVRQFK
jgi:ankyrin repeat protein